MSCSSVSGLVFYCTPQHSVRLHFIAFWTLSPLQITYPEEFSWTFSFRDNNPNSAQPSSQVLHTLPFAQGPSLQTHAARSTWSLTPGVPCSQQPCSQAPPSPHKLLSLPHPPLPKLTPTGSILRTISCTFGSTALLEITQTWHIAMLFLFLNEASVTEVLAQPGTICLCLAPRALHLLSTYLQVLHYSFFQICYKISHPLIWSVWLTALYLTHSPAFGEPKYWVLVCHLHHDLRICTHDAAIFLHLSLYKKFLASALLPISIKLALWFLFFPSVFNVSMSSSPPTVLKTEAMVGSCWSHT